MNTSHIRLPKVEVEQHNSAIEPEVRKHGEMANPRSSARYRIGTVLLTFIWVPLLVLLELIFPLFVDVTDMRFNYWDPLVGPRPIPNQSGRYIRGIDINARYHFNAQGWNHPEDYVIAKTPGSVRVALVGDSMVEALEVDPEQSMTVLASQRMNQPGRPAQWYSFGLSGWGPTHEYQMIRHYVLEYQPDLVIVMFVQNDPEDISPYLTMIPSYEPKLSLGQDGELSFEPGTYMRPAWRGPLAARSALFRYFAIQKGLWARLTGKGVRAALAPVPLRGDRQSTVDEVPAEKAQKTWALIEKTFEAIRDECRKRGAIFAVVYRGHNGYLDSLVQGKTYTTPPKEVDPYSLRERYDEMGREFVEPITQRLGVPYLDLTESLATMIIETGSSHHFFRNSHYNERGHEAVGEALSSWAETLLSQNDNT